VNRARAAFALALAAAVSGAAPHADAVSGAEPRAARALVQSADKDPVALRARLLDGSLDAEPRVKAGFALLSKDPEALGTALAEMGKKKDAAAVPVLVGLAVKIAPRHLRLLATAAAKEADGPAALTAFLGRTGASDMGERVRAVECAGLLFPLSKDKDAQAKLLELARTGPPLVAIEAIRGLSRSPDAKLEKEMLDLCVTVGDDHVRKHAAWAVLDRAGERNSLKKVESMKGRPGEAGARAVEAAEVLRDAEERPFEWDPQPLKRVLAWWSAGRSTPGRIEINIGDKETKEKVDGFLAELRTTVPAWAHLVECAFGTVALGGPTDPLVDYKSKAVRVRASEILQCQTNWQGAYVLVRNAGIAISEMVGEPFEDHRGWEPSYQDVHAFQIDTKRAPGALPDFVGGMVGKKPWR
jgi:hypothetical protein